MNSNNIPDEICQSANQELADSAAIINNLDELSIGSLLVEACRVLDYWYVQNTLSEDKESKLDPQLLDIITRGWNRNTIDGV